MVEWVLGSRVYVTKLDVWWLAWRIREGRDREHGRGLLISFCSVMDQ
jgi:hypothetical protein